MLNAAFGSISALVIPILAPWAERSEPSLRLPAIVAQAQQIAADTADANVIPFVPPAIPGLGSSGGFSFVLQDFSGGDIQEFASVMRGLIVAANEQPAVGSAFSTFRADVTMLFLDVNRDKVQTLQVPMSELFATLQAQLGSTYINDFNKFGRTWRVMAQAPIIFGLALLFVYLFLVAQYESWSIPFAVLLAVPVAVLGALATVGAAGLDVNL